MSSDTGRITPKGGPPSTRRPATFDHLKKKPPVERTVSIVMSHEAALAYEEAASALERARLVKQATDVLAQAAEAAREALEAETVSMRFRSIGRKAYDELVEDHQVSDEERDRALAAGEDVPPYEVKTFAPALIAASCVEPRLTDAQVLELWDEWNTAELMELWAAALEVNTQRRVVDPGKAGYG